MKTTKMMIIGLLGLALMTAPAQARAHFGFGFGSGFYGPLDYGYSGFYPYGGYYGGPYGAPVYSRPMVVPSGGVPMIQGAYGYIDEGDFRNYRDAAGSFLGRVPLASIPAGRW